MTREFPEMVEECGDGRNMATDHNLTRGVVVCELDELAAGEDGVGCGSRRGFDGGDEIGEVCGGGEKCVHADIVTVLVGDAAGHCDAPSADKGDCVGQREDSGCDKGGEFP